MRLLFFVLIFFTVHKTYANIQVSPHRVFLSKVSQGLSSAMLYVINKSDKPVSYRISLTFMKGDSNGSMMPLEEKENAKLNEMFARTIIYSPKQIVDLKPKEVQNVRLAMRPPRDIENLQGEYFAMITFTPINITPITDQTSNKNVSTQVVVAVTVRVPLRVTFISNPDYTSTIANVLLERKGNNAKLNFDIINKTNFTPYGSVSILTYDDNPNDAKEILSIPAIVIPNPTEAVSVKQELNRDVVKQLKKKVIIRYNSFTPLQNGNANTIIAEKTVDI